MFHFKLNKSKLIKASGLHPLHLQTYLNCLPIFTDLILIYICIFLSYYILKKIQTKQTFLLSR